MQRLKGNTYRRAVRDTIADIDYVAKLSPDERDWLEIFVDATAGNNEDAQACLAGTPEKFKKLHKAVYDEHNARARDMLNKFSRAPYKESSELDEDEYIIERVAQVRSSVFQHYRCSRCLRNPEKCECPARQRHKPYGMDDYTPVEQTEDELVSALDLKKRMQAFDLLPYGDNPPDLKPGHTVQVCLPHHLFKNAVGQVLAFRQWDGAYLVDVKTKQGLRDREGKAPKQSLLWVKGPGLKRAKLKLVN